MQKKHMAIGPVGFALGYAGELLWPSGTGYDYIEMCRWAYLLTGIFVVILSFVASLHIDSLMVREDRIRRLALQRGSVIHRVLSKNQGRIIRRVYLWAAVASTLVTLTSGWLWLCVCVAANAIQLRIVSLGVHEKTPAFAKPILEDGGNPSENDSRGP